MLPSLAELAALAHADGDGDPGSGDRAHRRQHHGDREPRAAVQQQGQCRRQRDDRDRQGDNPDGAAPEQAVPAENERHDVEREDEQTSREVLDE